MSPTPTHAPGFTPVLPAEYQTVIDKLTQQFPDLLGDNLFSLVLYGSTVRGNVVQGVSDINILIVLNQSTPDAHIAIADCINNEIKIEPFIIARKGMQRSFAVFAIKFRSIQRNYKVLYGTDPLSDFNVEQEKLKFLVEQALRNIRLRSINTYIHQREHPRRYAHFLLDAYTVVFTHASEIIRLHGHEVPGSYEQRISIISDFFKIDVTALYELVKIQNNPGLVNLQSIASIHERLFTFLSHIVDWMEEHW